MQWRIVSPEEEELFNDYLAHSPKGHILQTWQWGEVKKVSGWQPIRIIVEEENSIVAACSILKRRLPFGLGSLFYAARGPVLDIEREDVWQLLLQAIKELAIPNKAIFLKIDPDVPEDDLTWKARLIAAGFINAEKGEGFEGVQPRHVFRLDISLPEEDLLRNMNQKTRYNLRLAEKKGVTVARGGLSDLPVFYQLLQETAVRDKFLIRNYEYYKTFYEELAPEGLTELFLTYYDGKVIAGALAFLLGDKAWYIYGASANEYRNVMPNYLLQWRMIQWAKQKGSTLYDFRGVPGDVPEDHPLYGLVKFKKGFGGLYISFIGEYDLVYDKLRYRFYHFLEPLYQKGIRKLIRLKKKIKKLIK